MRSDLSRAAHPGRCYWWGGDGVVAWQLGFGGRAARVGWLASGGLPMALALVLVSVLAGCRLDLDGRSAGGGSAPPLGVVSKPATRAVLCDLHERVRSPSPSVPDTARYDWTCTEAERRLRANGLPDHAVGEFPNPHNPHTMAAHTVSQALALNPVLGPGVSARNRPGVPMGYALNGVTFDPGTAGTCDDTGTGCDLGHGHGHWNIEALGQSHFHFGTDGSNGHVQPGGVYHYHGVPEALVAKLKKGETMTLIGWALDGFPIYARYGFSRSDDAASALVSMQTSYVMKAHPDPGRPPVSSFPMGTFTQDYVYRAGTGDLDECNGRFGVTPEFPAGTYHYFATDDYPYIQRCVKGWR